MAGGFVPFEGGAAEKAALVADIRKRFVTVIREWGEKDDGDILPHAGK